MGIKDKKDWLKQEIKERLSPDTISDSWKKVKKVSGVVFIVSSLIGAAPVSFPVGVASWIGYVTLISGVIAGRAHLNKSNNLKSYSK